MNTSNTLRPTWLFAGRPFPWLELEASPQFIRQPLISIVGEWSGTLVPMCGALSIRSRGCLLFRYKAEKCRNYQLSWCGNPERQPYGSLINYLLMSHDATPRILAVVPFQCHQASDFCQHRTASLLRALAADCCPPMDVTLFGAGTALEGESSLGRHGS